MTRSHSAHADRLLQRSYRGKYPFKIGTTSFVYPDHYAANTRLLAPFLDEIELLFFESLRASDDLLIREMETLADLAEDFGITYNVHLPTDIDLGNGDTAIRQQAVDAIRDIIDLTTPLSPTTYTLHLEYFHPTQTLEDISRWRKDTRKGLKRLLSEGLALHMLSIENLSYPFSWIEPIIGNLDLRICMDIGHLLIHGIDVAEFYHRHAEIIQIIHLHGVDDGQDHQALSCFSDASFTRILSFLREFTGTLSIEVFSFDDLQTSLTYLDHRW